MSFRAIPGAVVGGDGAGGGAEVRRDSIELHTMGMLLMVATNRPHGMPTLPGA